MNVSAVCGRLKAKKADTTKIAGLRDLKNNYLNQILISEIKILHEQLRGPWMIWY